MDTLNGRPKLLKQANLSLIRKVITAEGTATRAEIARKTNISSTTVRSLLAEMLENGEIESLGFDESSGGGKPSGMGLSRTATMARRSACTTAKHTAFWWTCAGRSWRPPPCQWRMAWPKLPFLPFWTA